MERDITCTRQEYSQIKKNIRENRLPVVIKGRPKKVGRVVYVKLVGDNASIDQAVNPSNAMEQDLALMSLTLISIVIQKLLAFIVLYCIFWGVSLAFNAQIPVALPFIMAIFIPTKPIPQKVLKISKKYSNF